MIEVAGKYSGDSNSAATCCVIEIRSGSQCFPSSSLLQREQSVRNIVPFGALVAPLAKFLLRLGDLATIERKYVGRGVAQPLGGTWSSVSGPILPQMLQAPDLGPTDL